MTKEYKKRKRYKDGKLIIEKDEVIKPKPQGRYYDVKIEASVPATLVYKVYAYSPQEAIEIAEKFIGARAPNYAKYHIAKLKKIKLTIYKAGSSIIEFFKNFL